MVAMKHKVFIPVSDEILYKYPELITAPLRPYQIDSPCFHWMATIESEHDSNEIVEIKRFDHTTPLVDPQQEPHLEPQRLVA